MALETNVDPSFLYYEGYTQTTPGESSYTVAFADYDREQQEAYWEQQAEQARDDYYLYLMEDMDDDFDGGIDYY